MGRPKADHSDSVYSACGIQGKALIKRQCRKCYAHEFYKTTNVGEKREERLAATKKWNRANRDRFNENKRRSKAGEKLERIVTDVACSVCTEILPHFAKGMCLSCYGKKYHKRMWPKKKAQRYGMSEEEHQQMVTAANGHCEVCERPFERLMIDHNHKTRKVRGLLCGRCNVLIGYVETTSDEVLHKMRIYLEKHNEQKQT